jgi:hypothetical protein
MNKVKFAALFVFVIGCVALSTAQNNQVTNRAGAPFPTMQYQPTAFTADSQTSDMISKDFYRGNAEIRTPGIIVHADEAIHDVKTGQVELRGTLTATMVPLKPIWPEAR